MERRAPAPGILISDLDPLSTLQPWLQHRADDLQLAYDLLLRALQSRSLPAAGQFSSSTVWTAAGTILALQAAVILVTGIGRKSLLQAADTVLATALLIALIALVLALPIGELPLFTLKAVQA